MTAWHFIALSSVPGWSENVQEHPCSEALFNFVNAWSLMLWPLMATDGKSAHVKGKGWWYIGTQVPVTWPSDTAYMP